MPSTKAPRSGSMQYWPRKRAKKAYARIRSWAKSDKPKLQGFVGYKVGMTHYIGVQQNKNSHLKGEEIAVPVTIVECPPVKIFSIRFYKYQNGLKLSKEIFLKADKTLARKLKVPKDNSAELEKINPDDYSLVRVLVYTQPSKAGFGKKTPELMEMSVAGNNVDIITYVKENADKDIDISTIFDENQLVDVHAVTKGKGTQGPVKRFGIGLRESKSEKGVRTPGSIGPWVRQQHISYRVARAGQTGFHQRVDLHKQILKISDEENKEHFHKYGQLKSNYILLHGSIPGPKKRTVIMTNPMRKQGKKLHDIQ